MMFLRDIHSFQFLLDLPCILQGARQLLPQS